MPQMSFPTKFGNCGVAWMDSALTRFEFFSQAPSVAEPLPDWIAELIARVQRHFEGDFQDFSSTPLLWSLVGDFQQSVFRRTQAIPAGHTKSYGDIARELSLPATSSRSIGTALGSNPWPLIVPCHRVVAASGKMTGFSAPGGVLTKTRLLALEGAELLSE